MSREYGLWQWDIYAFPFLKGQMMRIRSLIALMLLLHMLPAIGLGFEKESEHFIFSYEAPDSGIVDSIMNRLERCYPRITGDLQLTITLKTKVHIYPTLQAFHDAIGWSNAPDWLVGMGTSEIFAVSPLNPGPVHTYREMLENVFIHEFTHICTGRINTALPSWLSEGFACYEGGPYYSTASVRTAYASLGRIPSLDELGASYNNFVSLGGYPFSLTIARFAIGRYGMDAMRRFIIRPYDFSVFAGATKDQFQLDWYEYVREKYLGPTDIAGPAQNGRIVESGLGHNHPNPFNPSTIIPYRLATDSHIRMEVFDINGRCVSQLADEYRSAGMHSVRFDGTSLSDGVYVVRWRATSQDGHTATGSRRIILIK